MREYDGKRFNQLPGDEVFFHLLRCPHCRDMALAQFGVHKALAAPPPPAPRRKKPVVRKEAEWLFDGLMRLSSKKRIEAAKDPRYHRADLLDLILEKSEAAQAENVSRADEMAWLAVSLATNIDADDVGLRKRLVRAFCLAGNARRMAGDRSAAESAFDNARGEVERLIAELEAGSQGLGGRDIALEVLRGFASEHLKGTDPRQRARMYSRELRQTFRLRNLRSGALPWI